ncbi:MAG: LCP family protein [Anaerolineae bacterium]|jgi:LCP family protein required for cell wall assembly
MVTSRQALATLLCLASLLWPLGVRAEPPASVQASSGLKVNILLLGLDADSGALAPSRTDTIILASVDLGARRMAMVSIPRDLWVDIPGYSQNRINTAYFTGEYNRLPGGGPALAMQTVAAALGVPVDHYITIDFDGFVGAVDAIGGLDIDVPYDILRYEYIDGKDSSVLDIPAGLQHMDGAATLTYVRSRYNSNDYERMRRQQQVLLTARDKALSLQIPVSRYPELLVSLGSAVHTDIPFVKLVALGSLAMRMDSSDITHVVIDESIASTVIRPSGAMVEVPDWDKLHALVNEALYPKAEEPTEPDLLTRFVWGR